MVKLNLDTSTIYIVDLVMELTGMSIRIVYKIRKEMNEGTVSTPNKYLKQKVMKDPLSRY